ncbi:MAG: cyanophycinase [Gemmataceae bacterium]|nr:cyanophycinase [Gemmataceae bacterium]
MNTLVFLAVTLAAAPDAPPVKLLAVGGGSDHPAVSRKAIDMGGGPGKCRMAILPFASERENAGERSAAFWREQGAAQVTVVDLKDRAKAIETLNSSDMIWMPGGDQNRLMKALIGADLVGVIQSRMKAGAAVGGTSAGAAVLSGVMLTGEADLSVIRGNQTVTAKGLDLWPGAIVDQHFVKRQRFQRLLSAVLDHPTLVGVGIDESTAVAVIGTSCEVIGASQAVVVDAREAKAPAAEAGKPRAATGVRVSVYTPGMKFDLAKP